MWVPKVLRRAHRIARSSPSTAGFWCCAGWIRKLRADTAPGFTCAVARARESGDDRFRACRLLRRSSSLLKNLESGAFSVFLPVLGWAVGVCSVAGNSFSLVIGRGLRRQQFGNADQIVGDQIDHEIGSDTGYPAMFG